MDRLLDIKDLKVNLFTAYGEVRGVRGVSAEVGEGEIVGIVGESGCGKTLTAKSILGLHNPERTELSGKIEFCRKNGGIIDLISAQKGEMKKIRGSEISMVLQDSSAALSPIITIGKQMGEVISAHKKVSKSEAAKIAEKLLYDVGIPEPGTRLKCLPGELSGGQLQRICIAMAISSEPRLLIADEPTTALDAVTQAQILELLKNLSVERNMAILIVTHNFSVVKRLCDRVYVMYAGLIAESGSVKEVIEDPRHRYTRDLLQSVPDGTKKRLKAASGPLPDIYSDICGCPYFERCAERGEGCEKEISLKSLGGSHFAACIKAGGE